MCGVIFCIIHHENVNPIFDWFKTLTCMNPRISHPDKNATVRTIVYESRTLIYCSWKQVLLHSSAENYYRKGMLFLPGQEMNEVGNPRMVLVWNTCSLRECNTPPSGRAQSSTCTMPRVQCNIASNLHRWINILSHHDHHRVALYATYRGWWHTYLLCYSVSCTYNVLWVYYVDCFFLCTQQRWKHDSNHLRFWK